MADPLRRQFLEVLAANAPLLPPLAEEWMRDAADLVIVVAQEALGPVLVLAGGDLGGARRWTLRQPVDDLSGGDVLEAWEGGFVARGRDPLEACRLAEARTGEFLAAVRSAVEHCAVVRPEQRSPLLRLLDAMAGGLERPLPAFDLDGFEDDGFEDDGFEDREFEDREFEDREFEDAEEDDVEDGMTLPSPSPSRPPMPRRAPQRRRRSVARSLGAGLLVVTVIATAVGLVVVRSGDVAGPDRSQAAAAEPTTAPTAPPDYAVAQRNADGSAVRFDPCVTYDVVVQPGTADPEVAAEDVGAAFGAVERATGIAFRYLGFTEETVPYPSPPETERRHILVSFEAPESSDALRRGAIQHGYDEGHPLAGLAQPEAVNLRPGFAVLTGGTVAVNQALDSTHRRRVLLHELGHAVGLDHAADPEQVMARHVPTSGPVAYRAGDVAGLAELGSGGCILTDDERRRLFG
jgi:hypothetical protein